ncbi:MFS transporter [Massilia sp. S19_KUP03_FR1]|uniref:MFS transporter n=1 Tax=Massilia sp. S19_KUP03_FR1 TaxID=3025503 RepID=UPI002FCD93A7
MHVPTLKTNPNFRWLLRGAIVSNLGDQLTVVALPLLVLQLTGDPLALGLVIALIGLPRAIFILLGGALVDRFSPQRVLMASKLANAVLLILLALLVMNTHPVLTLELGTLLSIAVTLTPHLVLMLVCALAFSLGLAQAFSIPAGAAIVPAALPATLLEAGNGALMGLRQLALLAGPLLAVWLLGARQHGLALAFALDAASFLVSAWMLARVVLHADRPAGAAPLLRALGAGLVQLWRDSALRLCFIYWALVAVCIGGAMQVALPVLATQLAGAGTLAWLMAANGGGILLGMAAAALGGPRLRFSRFGCTILLVDALVGCLVMPLGVVDRAWLAALLLLGLGVLSGYLQITIYSWIGRRVPAALMGRAMSIFMFIFMGLAPLSAAGAGWLLRFVSLPQLFLGGGLVLLTLAALAWLLTPMRHIPLAPLTAP